VLHKVKLFLGYCYRETWYCIKNLDKKELVMIFFVIAGDKLFFDKRDNTEFDLLTVNETSVEPPQDDGNSLNSPRNLALEATFINHNFSQQVS
jgi:hypothetical protein